MKKITKWAALLLVLALLPFGASAQESTAQEGGTAVAAVRELDIAVALGILPADSQPGGTVTRGAAVSATVKMLGFQGIAADGAGFSDVDSSNAYVNEIAIAKQLGIVSGYPDNTFRPDEVISANELITLLVKGIGYGPIAEENGGYPTGYLKWAVDKKL